LTRRRYLDILVHISNMLSQTAEYALRAVVYLASQAARPVTTLELAEAAKVPAGYLSKVLQTLSRTGIVSAQRGKRGGFSLARPSAKLTLLEIVNAVDPPARILKCPLNLKSHRARLCPLHQRLDEAAVMVEHAFGRTTIAGLLAESRSSRKPLCTIAGATHA
jgi:Rrf2 family protein